MVYLLMTISEGYKGFMLASDNGSSERLLQAMAEQLKVPLMQIARQSELSQRVYDDDSYSAITNIAEIGLQLVDSYLLSSQLKNQNTLLLEPVAVSSILFDVAHKLDPIAKQYDLSLEVNLAGKYEPIMGHRKSLEAAFTMLGYSYIETSNNSEQPVIILGAHKSSYGLVAGLFAGQKGLTTDMFRRARALYGTSRQPLPALSPSAGAGIFIADSLFQSMATRLKVAHHHKLAGLAVTLLPSRQLQLV